MTKLLIVGLSVAAWQAMAEQGFKLDFDGADPAPTLSKNISFVDGIDGKAVFVPTKAVFVMIGTPIIIQLH